MFCTIAIIILTIAIGILLAYNLRMCGYFGNSSAQPKYHKPQMFYIQPKCKYSNRYFGTGYELSQDWTAEIRNVSSIDFPNNIQNVSLSDSLSIFQAIIDAYNNILNTNHITEHSRNMFTETRDIIQDILNYTKENLADNLVWTSRQEYSSCWSGID